MAGMVIIGAGECGVRAAMTLRENGYDGPVTLIGAEPHLPYERPPLSKGAMTCDGAPLAKTINARDVLEAAGIDCLTGTAATAIDPAGKTVTLSGGRMLPFDRLLIATGANPRRLPLAGAEDVRCLSLRTFDDALKIRAHLDRGSRIAILGGGFIGLELAASARKRGAAVTVIEAQKRLLMRGVPEEIAAVIEARHRAEGVDIRCGTGLAAIEPGIETLHLSLSDGTRLDVELLVIGIGAVPEMALAEAAGLAIDNGIAVDSRLATSVPDIFAAGDCCSFPSPVYDGRRIRLEAWRSAQEHGALAARNMLGHDMEIEAVPWFWSDQYDLTLQIAGLADGAARHVRRDLGGGALHPVPSRRRWPAPRGQRHRPGQRGRPRHPPRRNADRQARAPERGRTRLARGEAEEAARGVKRGVQAERPALRGGA